jgi:integrase
MDSLTHVKKKGHRLFFRRKVPRKLVSRVGRSEIIRSLPHGSLLAARRRSRTLWIATETLFSMLLENPQVTPAQVEKLLAAIRADCAWADEVKLAGTGAIFDHSGTPPPDADAICLETEAYEYRQALRRNDISGVEYAIRKYAKIIELAGRPTPIDWHIIGRTILRGFAESCESAASNLRSDNDWLAQEAERTPSVILNIDGRDVGQNTEGDDLSDPFENGENRQSQDNNSPFAEPEPQSAPTRQLAPNTPASEAWEIFIQDQITFEGWRDTRKAKSSLNLWEAAYGKNKPICNWTSGQANELRRLFAALPKKYAQEKEWKKFPDIWAIASNFQKQIKDEKDPGKRKELLKRTTKFKTWNRHWSIFNALWPFAIKNGLVPHGTPSPFDGLFLKKRIDLLPERGGSEQRKMWDTKQRIKLLMSPLFTGFKSPNQRWMTGTVLDRGPLYWAVLILAHTGMRREEVCQLHVNHVRQDPETSIWYFNLKAEGLQLKNPESKRWVPVPDNILKLGFIEHRVAGRNPDEMLFPELYASSDNRYGDKLGQQFLEYRKNHDKHQQALLKSGDEFVPLYEHLLDLHSLRHTFVTLLFRAGVPDAHIQQLIGHKSVARDIPFGTDEHLTNAHNSETTRIYNKGSTLPILKSAMDKLDLGIDIECLIQAAS